MKRKYAKEKTIKELSRRNTEKKSAIFYSFAEA